MISFAVEQTNVIAKIGQSLSVQKFTTLLSYQLLFEDVMHSPDVPVIVDELMLCFL